MLDRRGLQHEPADAAGDRGVDHGVVDRAGVQDERRRDSLVADAPGRARCRCRRRGRCRRARRPACGRGSSAPPSRALPAEPTIRKPWRGSSSSRPSSHGRMVLDDDDLDLRDRLVVRAPMRRCDVWHAGRSVHRDSRDRTERISSIEARKASSTSGSKCLPLSRSHPRDRRLQRPRQAVAAVGRQGVEDVGHGGDPAFERDLRARQPGGDSRCRRTSRGGSWR